MRGKKLLTVGSAAGIVAWGACFTPPPRIRVNLQGSRRIVIRVSNTSETQHVDPAVLGPCIARAVNSDLRGRVTTVVGGEPWPGDTVLEVVVTKEEAKDRPVVLNAKNVEWGSFLWLNATLKRSDGTGVWTNLYQQYFVSVQAPQSAGPWDSEPLAKGLRDYVCAPMADEMAYNGR